MATSFYEHQIRAEKLAIFTSTEEVEVREFREFLVEKWKTLSAGLDNGTILFIAGVHGTDERPFGPIQHLVRSKTNQKKSPNCWEKLLYQIFIL